MNKYLYMNWHEYTANLPFSGSHSRFLRFWYKLYCSSRSYSLASKVRSNFQNIFCDMNLYVIFIYRDQTAAYRGLSSFNITSAARSLCSNNTRAIASVLLLIIPKCIIPKSLFYTNITNVRPCKVLTVYSEFNMAVCERIERNTAIMYKYYGL